MTDRVTGGSLDFASAEDGGQKALGAFAWTPAHLDAGAAARSAALPVIGEGDFARIDPELDIWDAWPVQEEHGAPYVLEDGATLWMALGAPRSPDPDDRHGQARIHLLRKDAAGRWSHHGQVMPEGFSPGSREWSGSAVLDANGRTLTLYFTATGRRDEAKLTFLQRMFVAEATLVHDTAGPRFTDWGSLEEIVDRDGRWYMSSEAGTGTIGMIKAFRDPAYFRDPAGDGRYITFAGSDAQSDSRYNGVIGLARGGESGPWVLEPPIVTAAGFNNELERPHLVHHRGLYYLFWSTQRHVFNPEATVGPTGLYGLVAERIGREWTPLNGSGLVFATPAAAPAQSYSWFVLPDLTVISFVDNWGQPDLTAERRFGATFAPEVQLGLDGDRAWLVR